MDYLKVTVFWVSGCVMSVLNVWQVFVQGKEVIMILRN